MMDWHQTVDSEHYGPPEPNTGHCRLNPTVTEHWRLWNPSFHHIPFHISHNIPFHITKEPHTLTFHTCTIPHHITPKDISLHITFHNILHHCFAALHFTSNAISHHITPFHTSQFTPHHCITIHVTTLHQLHTTLHVTLHFTSHIPHTTSHTVCIKLHSAWHHSTLHYHILHITVAFHTTQPHSTSIPVSHTKFKLQHSTVHILLHIWIT